MASDQWIAIGACYPVPSPSSISSERSTRTFGARNARTGDSFLKRGSLSSFLSLLQYL